MIMKFLGLLALFILIGITSCSSDSELTQEEEAQALKETLSEIQATAISEPCTDSTEVSFTAIGSKACGGPTGYIAYSLNIDVDQFLAQVSDYSEKQREFNMKWGVNSDCSVETPPGEVTCENGVAKFVL